MLRIAFFLLTLLALFSAQAATWTQQFSYAPIDNNGAATELHEYQYRVNGGVWSAVMTSPTLPVLADIVVSNEDVIEIRGRPCAVDNFCPPNWLVVPYSVPPDMVPYSQAVITVGPAGWQND